MNLLRTIVIDDEPHFIEIVEIFLKDIPNVELIGTAQSVNQAEQLIHIHKPDLILLDIEMPKQNGFDLLRKFSNPQFKVIFVTGYDHYAIRAIKFSAIDYLLKPIDPDELSDAISKVSSTLFTQDNRVANFIDQNPHDQNLTKIMISSLQGFQTISVKDIVSIESRPGNYSIFTTRLEQRYVSTKPLKYYDELFSDKVFFRAHRSYIINLHYFNTYDHDSGVITLIDNQSFSIATRRRNELNTLLRDYFTH